MRPDYKKKIAVCKDCQSKKSLGNFLETHSDIDEIWGDHAIFWDFELTSNTQTIPLFFLNAIYADFEKPALLDPNMADTVTIFNFIINKKMHHRYLTLRLIEYFNLQHFDYTYSGSAKNINDERIFQDLLECDPDRKQFPPDRLMEILGDVTLKPKFFAVDNFISDAILKGSIPHYGGNCFSWKSGLDKIFGNSFISLITESDNGDYDKTTVITEKTLYAILGLTIPVWPGGYRHAEGMQEMGFDVFSDLIDHSYQHEHTMFMRCFRAFEDNIEILKDLQSAKLLREEIMPRLVRNREHLFSYQLIDWYRNRLKNWKNCDESMRNLLAWYPNARRLLHLPIKT